MPTFAGGDQLLPIPSFSGTFRGNGYSIRGLAIGGKRSTAGLFLKIGETGEIYDLNVSGNIQPGGDCEAVGGIAAVNEGLIQNCSFSGSVSGRLNTGGIAGTNAAGNRIRDCSVSGSMEGARQTGGIAGYSTGIIEDCTNTSVIGYPHVSYNTGRHRRKKLRLHRQLRKYRCDLWPEGRRRHRRAGGAVCGAAAVGKLAFHDRSAAFGAERPH